MLRLSKAGLFAAGIQFVAVILATFAAFHFAPQGLGDPTSPNVADGLNFRSSANFSFLRWVYLLTSVGVALTGGRVVDATAAHISYASRLIRPMERDHATKTLLVQLSFTAIGFAITTLTSPPDLLVEGGRHLGCSCIAFIGWSGAMSIGTAGFGANAFAAGKALGR
jgi:hypothetical protein